ncbi:MAG: primosomal protein N' [Betaproteobacteria bacterium]|nr:primosomal protein N' [Betaproteobacteria bacterium]
MPIARVALDLPLSRLFDYRVADDSALTVGVRLLVPFGKREKIGVLVELATASKIAPEQLKEAVRIEDDLPPLPPEFFRLCEFAAQYYQTTLGEAIHQALPPALKKTRPAIRRATKKREVATPLPQPVKPELNAEQANAVALIAAARGFQPFLLYGVTGSGKTEVYLRLLENVLAEGLQVLLLAPEINLTPQLETRIQTHFPGVPLVMLHSGLTEAAREKAWRAAFLGEAGIVVGTRLAVFTPMPYLGLIIVDEEHDLSYKQQEGMRYSARDLAIYRASLGKMPIVLGSATPSLESWAHAQHGRYRLVTLLERAVSSARLPVVRMLDTRKVRLEEGLCPSLIEALRQRLEKGEQSLIFLNRRGYAPVLACPACAWISHCSRCAANLVVHLEDKRLRCHHCALETKIPLACPACGNRDIQPFGRGTQRIEAALAGQFPGARVLRVDRDSARSRKQWETILTRIHAGEVDILVGTQMLAKGHDFPRLTLVGVVGADAALFAADWRAPERLFAQLMQVAGRAGRADLPGEVLIQSEYPEHPLYNALTAHDYTGYAKALLEERRQAGFPPYAYQAMLRAEAPRMAMALAFIRDAVACANAGDYPGLSLFDAVPMRLSRLMNMERAQLLIESPSRAELQAFLAKWREILETMPRPRQLRWHLEVDPLEV